MVYARRCFASCRATGQIATLAEKLAYVGRNEFQALLNLAQSHCVQLAADRLIEGRRREGVATAIQRPGVTPFGDVG